MSRESSFVVLVMALLLALAAATLPARTDRTWIDAVTGSGMSQTSWFALGEGPVVTESALEGWIVAHGGAYHHKWHYLSHRSRNLFGMTLAVGCSLAPEIYPLHGSDVNARYVRSAT